MYHDYLYSNFQLVTLKDTKLTAIHTKIRAIHKTVQSNYCPLEWTFINDF